MDASKVFAPIKALFSNVAFVTALLSTLGAVVVILVPAFEPYRDMVVKGAIGVILLAAGGSAAASVTKPIAEAKVQVAQAEAVTAQAELAKAQMAQHSIRG